MHKISKGEYGYITYTRRMAVIRTVVMFVLCLSVFAIGYLTSGTRRNLLTIVAVLGCLPASKSLVNVIMFIKAHGCSADAHDRIEGVMDSVRKVGEPVFADAYDLYLTAYQSDYPLSHVIAGRGMVTGLCESGRVDISACEKHIEEHLRADGIKDMTVKIYTGADKYTSRLKAITELETREGDTGGAAVLATLKAISL
ncbi:MAG: hypothetical protein K5673_10670 [Lachnospiraceae bacterium]|nr:hypothetical protein [Lachnospiraceae bacterium]